MPQPAPAPLQASAKPTFLLDTMCARLCRWLRCAAPRADLLVDVSDKPDLKCSSRTWRHDSGSPPALVVV